MSSENKKPPTRVLIVDDSAFMRTALSRMIACENDLTVVGKAGGGDEALQRIAELDPDVVTLDVAMPQLDGLETLRRIMAQFPRPVIMVSSETQKDTEATFNALSAGAFDYVPKLLSGSSLNILHIREDLVRKIRAAADSAAQKNKTARKPPQAAESPARSGRSVVPDLVAIGISTGGPKALQEILPSLPADLGVAIVVVQHMPLGFTGPFAARLNSICATTVCEASHGQRLLAGTVYIAPSGTQMTVTGSTHSQAAICLSDRPERQLHVPSADILMKSVASLFGQLSMGVIMTGMGADGADGMSAIHQEGGLTVGQNESTCAVYGMPRVCAEMGILDRIVPLSQIPLEIMRATNYRSVNVG